MMAVERTRLRRKVVDAQASVQRMLGSWLHDEATDTESVVLAVANGFDELADVLAALLAESNGETP